MAAKYKKTQRNVAEKTCENYQNLSEQKQTIKT